MDWVWRSLKFGGFLLIQIVVCFSCGAWYPNVQCTGFWHVDCEASVEEKPSAAVIGLKCFNLHPMLAFQEWITTTPPGQKPMIELWDRSATRFSTNTSAGHMALPLHWLSQLWFGITVSRHRWNPCTDGGVTEKSWAPAFGQGELHREPLGTIRASAYYMFGDYVYGSKCYWFNFCTNMCLHVYFNDNVYMYTFHRWPKNDAIFTQFDCFGAKNAWQFKACIVTSICSASWRAKHRNATLAIWLSALGLAVGTLFPKIKTVTIRYKYFSIILSFWILLMCCKAASSRDCVQWPES